MFTDSVPKQTKLRAEYLESDGLSGLELPMDDRLRAPVESIQ